MNIFQKVWRSIQESDNQTYLDIIDSEKRQNENLIQELSEAYDSKFSLESENNSLKETNAEYYSQMCVKNIAISNLEDSLEQYEIEEDNQDLIDYLNNKHKGANITYRGRYLVTGERIPIPVNLLITPTDPVIIQDLKDWGLYRTGESPETLGPKIHKKYKQVYYKYRRDITAWDKYEFWEYFYEMRERARLEGLDKLEFDCDSHAQALAGYYIAAGIPRWRVRVVVGNSYVGGHSTNYIYSIIDNKWHHLNSTYGSCTGYDELTRFPTHTDAKSKTNTTGNDMLGIYKVWMSFNDLYCWCDFDDDIPENLKIE